MQTRPNRRSHSNDNWSLGRELPPWGFLLIYTIALAGVAVGVATETVSAQILPVFALANLIAAMLYRRSVYLTIWLLFTGISLWITATQESVALSDILYVIVGSVVGAETVHRLASRHQKAIGELKQERDRVNDLLDAGKALEIKQAHRLDQLALLNSVGQEIASELELARLKQRTVDLIRETFGFDHVAILEIDSEEQALRMVARAGVFAEFFPPDHHLSIDQGLVGWACHHGKDVVCNDVDKDTRYVNRYPDRVPSKSELTAPIWVKGEIIGALDVQDAKRDAFGENDLLVLRTLSDQLGVAIGSANLYEALQNELRERLRAESALRASQNRLALALEGGDLGAWDWNHRTDTVVHSKRWATMLGYELDSIAPTFAGWQALVHPEDQTRFCEVLATNPPNSDDVFTLELRMRASDNKWRWILVRGRVTEWNTDATPSRVAGTTMDITARKTAEIALQELNASLETQVAERTNELKAERDKTEAILQTTGDAIALIDPRLRITYANPAFETATGYHVNEVLGQSVLTLIASPELAQEAVKRIKQTVQTETSWDGEITLKHKYGHTYDALLQIAPVRDVQGTVTSYLTSHRDVSPLKALQRMQTQFIANVSHELRTPIAILKLYTELLSDAGPEKRAQYESALLQETEHLTQLVESILHLNTLSAGGLSISKTPVLLNDLLQQYAIPSCPMLRLDKRPPVTLQLASESPIVCVDQTWLVEAICHIVDNAVRYTPDSGKITISTDCREEQDRTWAAITIADTGIGIPPDEQNHIFDQFFRGQRAGLDKRSGTGLGLNIAQTVVELHGGHISVDSTPDQGSTFVIWLPLITETPS